MVDGDCQRRALFSFSFRAGERACVRATGLTAKEELVHTVCVRRIDCRVIPMQCALVHCTALQMDL